MKCRFVHAADVHLGYEQYNLVQRANDFARAYLAMVDYAVDGQVDFVLIAGDLFHRAAADAWMLKQATVGLERLRQASIPVVTVEGNHDTQHARKHLSWLQFLCDQELLVLLDVHSAANGHKSLRSFDYDERRGSYVDIAGARIYGLKYYGAGTARMLEEIRELIEPGPCGYTILMLHTGLEGQVPHMHGGLTPGQIAPLHRVVDYLALGHVHKRLIENNWVFNPGSLETNSFEEMDWAHGFFDVQVDTDTAEKQIVREVATPELRPFRRISVGAEETGSLDTFVARAEEAIERAGEVPDDAVIELYFGGVAAFRRQDVPVDRLAALVISRYRSLTIRVRNNLVPPGLVSIRREERTSRDEIERQVVDQLVHQHADRRSHTTDWARLILDIKNMAVERDEPSSIVDHIRTQLAGMSADKGEGNVGLIGESGDDSPAQPAVLPGE